MEFFKKILSLLQWYAQPCATYVNSPPQFHQGFEGKKKETHTISFLKNIYSKFI